jgi:hypothetical protein
MPIKKPFNKQKTKECRNAEGEMELGLMPPSESRIYSTFAPVYSKKRIYGRLGMRVL